MIWLIDFKSCISFFYFYTFICVCVPILYVLCVGICFVFLGVGHRRDGFFCFTLGIVIHMGWYQIYCLDFSDLAVKPCLTLIDWLIFFFFFHMCFITILTSFYVVLHEAPLFPVDYSVYSVQFHYSALWVSVITQLSYHPLSCMLSCPSLPNF